MTTYLRHPSSVLEKLDLQSATSNPISDQTDLKTYLEQMCAAPGNTSVIQVNGVTELSAFGPLPDRYWIRCNTPRIMLFVNGSTERQRFVWTDTSTGKQTVQTADITTDSIVFLTPFGDKLSYGSDKLLYIDNGTSCNMRHPVLIGFIDNYGMAQTLQAETGTFEVKDTSANTFKSVSHEITYELGKIPTNRLTIGDSAIERSLQLFYSGFINSQAYVVVLDTEVDSQYELPTLDTALSDYSFTGDRYTGLYTLAGILQFNTADTATLLEYIGELNIN